MWLTDALAWTDVADPDEDFAMNERPQKKGE